MLFVNTEPLRSSGYYFSNPFLFFFFSSSLHFFLSLSIYIYNKQEMDLNGPWFTDKKTNRTVLFKGVNLSGGTKLPVGMPSHQRHGYWVDYDRKVSFVGRPFPLDEADEHLQRLVNLGFNLLRFVVTWEAIEHEGPYVVVYAHAPVALYSNNHRFSIVASTTRITLTTWLQFSKSVSITDCRHSSIPTKTA